jgi:hypothetical protein
VTNPARRALLAAAAALPACGAVPLGGDAGPLPVPTPRVGDRWRYQLILRPLDRWLDEPTFEVTEVRPDLVLKVTSRRSTTPLEERYTKPWTAAVQLFDGQPYAFDVPMPVVPVGDDPRSVRTTGAFADPETGRRKRWSQGVTVGGRETVQVPAGRFDCVRVSRQIAFESPDRYRSNSTRSETLWYSPQVGRWVQRELRGDYVSTGGGPGNPAEGTLSTEDWLMWQLTAWMPSPMG